MLAPNQILTAAQMREAEAALIAGGETVETLMERAGRGAADYVFRMAAGRAVTVLCGPGNNGGDGYVIARVLAERGVPVAVVAPLEPATDAARNARALWGGTPVAHAYGHIFVDCLFGTGLTRPLAEPMRDLLIDLIYSHDKWVAVDVPSGVDSDSGAQLNHRLPEYDLTIALGAWKRAHWLMPAAEMMGARRLIDIGVGAVAGATQLAERARLFAPPSQAHKYTRGLLAVVGGAMPGAAMLSARAALHGGAGYVKLLTDAPASTFGELVIDRNPLDLALADQRLSAVLVGPGLGRDDAARTRLQLALGFAGPLVLDADALMLLEPGMLAELSGGSLIATPHAGELGVLCESFGIGDGGRLERVARLARKMGAVVVAKGPDTLIASPEGALEVMPPALSWLSTAGTGDVLAGLIASRLATGSKPIHAAIEGCQLHAEAARLAGPAFSAGTLIENIPAAYASFM